MSSIESPCIRNCCLNEKDICLGCFRSIEEIMAWSKATDNEKQSMLVKAKQRQHEHNKKRFS